MLPRTKCDDVRLSKGRKHRENSKHTQIPSDANDDI